MQKGQYHEGIDETGEKAPIKVQNTDDA